MDQNHGAANNYKDPFLCWLQLQHRDCFENEVGVLQELEEFDYPENAQHWLVLYKLLLVRKISISNIYSSSKFEELCGHNSKKVEKHVPEDVIKAYFLVELFKRAIHPFVGSKQGDKDVNQKQKVGDALKEEQNAWLGIRHEGRKVGSVYYRVEDKNHHQKVPRAFKSGGRVDRFIPPRVFEFVLIILRDFFKRGQWSSKVAHLCLYRT